MSASLQQIVTDLQIALGIHVEAGSIVLHLNQGRVANWNATIGGRVETPLDKQKRLTAE